MPNERLRDTLLRQGLTPEQVARSIGVDPKTVARWITTGRAPYPKHRRAIAALVRESETYLWSDTLAPENAAGVAGAEVVKVYPHRHSVPRDLWDHLIGHTARNMDVLVFVGMFLTEYPALTKTLAAKAKLGTRIRLLLGDPNSPEVSRRSDDEGIGGNTIAAKIQHALAFYQPLADVSGVDVRLHGTTLYNSIYRFDDDMIVNTHVYGFAAPHAPTLHLRRLSTGDLFQTYVESFERVWNTASSPTW